MAAAVVTTAGVTVLLITGGAVVTVDDAFTVHDPGWVLIEGDRIAEVGPGEPTPATIDAADCDAVVIGTPIDLRRVVEITKPATRVRYDLKAHDNDRLVKAIEKGVRG